MGLCSEKTCESVCAGRTTEPEKSPRVAVRECLFANTTMGSRSVRTSLRASNASASRAASVHAATCAAELGGGERAARLARCVGATIMPSSSESSPSAPRGPSAPPATRMACVAALMGTARPLLR